MELAYFVLIAELRVLCTILLADLSVVPQYLAIHAKAVVAAWTLNMREARCVTILAVAAVGRTEPKCCSRVVDEVIE